MLHEDRYIIAEALEKVGKPLLAKDARQQSDTNILHQYVRVVQNNVCKRNAWHILEPLWSAGLVYA